MVSSEPDPGSDDRGSSGDASGFSLFEGGPLFRLLRWAHALENGRLYLRWGIAIALFAWLPLLILSAIEGHAFGRSTVISFLLDLEAHVRFLVALPLLVVAEVVTHQRSRHLFQQFKLRNLIPDSEAHRYELAIASAVRLRNSPIAEGLIVVFVYAVGIQIIWRHYVMVGAETWYSTAPAGGSELTFAGIWYGYVSLPIFQFLLCRWYFRIFVWARYLWMVSRIRLTLIPTHPDRIGGLGFLSAMASAFMVLAVAHGALLAGWLSLRIVYLDAELAQFKFEIGATVAFMLCITLGPLLLFSAQLASAKRRGLREYGALASQYVKDFDAKWLQGKARPGELFIGSSDIQSLADLDNSYSIVRSMRIIPIIRDDILRIVIATLLPIAPLLLTIMPVGELLERLMSIFFSAGL
ncbi:MAG: hypothetical protein SGJ07_08750 [Rhodospirillaceae bacterium]|nr:hypothetical protein [Rhodospirillaceae bacterium]